MSKENGGPAFPVPGWKDDESFNGMTLRDYFAVHANEEDVKEQREILRSNLGGGILPDNWVQIARYMHADAMLAERSKP